MRRAVNNRVAVVGGGISGITVAVLLHVNGFEADLYARRLPSRQPDQVPEPEFATLHAPASVLPHSVSSPNTAKWTAISHEFFSALSFRASCGVRSQLHYEIFEEPAVAPPDYARAVANFCMLAGSDLLAAGVPRRSGAVVTSGWKCDVLFCEAPAYVRYLYALHASLGGRVIHGDACPGECLSDYLALGYRYYVNCTGASAPAFVGSRLARQRFLLHYSDWPDQEAEVPFEPLEDPLLPKLIRGHYLRVALDETLMDERGRLCSYDYRPSAGVYRTVAGDPADVYCYPRSDAWILGGSRQEGSLDRSGLWRWDHTVGRETEFQSADGTRLAVPAPIFDLNAELLLRMTGGRLDLQMLYLENPSRIAPGVGYRFVRSAPYDSVRLAASRVMQKGQNADDGRAQFVLHNYGHGGAGFALSWGCAHHVWCVLRALEGSITGTQVEPRATTGRDTYAGACELLLGISQRLRDEPTWEAR